MIFGGRGLGWGAVLLLAPVALAQPQLKVDPAQATGAPADVKLDTEGKNVTVELPDPTTARSCSFSAKFDPKDYLAKKAPGYERQQAENFLESVSRTDELLKKMSDRMLRVSDDLKTNLATQAPSSITKTLDGLNAAGYQHSAYKAASPSERGLYRYMRSDKSMDSGWTPNGIAQGYGRGIGFVSAEGLYGWAPPARRSFKRAEAASRMIRQEDPHDDERILTNGQVVEAYPAALAHIARQNEIDKHYNQTVSSVALAVGMAASLTSFGTAAAGVATVKTMTVNSGSFAQVRAMLTSSDFRARAAMASKDFISKVSKAATAGAGTAVLTSVLTPLAGDSEKGLAVLETEAGEEELKKQIAALIDNQVLQRANDESKWAYGDIKDIKARLHAIVNGDKLDPSEWNNNLLQAESYFAEFEAGMSEVRSRIESRCARDVSEIVSGPDSTKRPDIAFAIIVQRRSECLSARQMLALLEISWIAKMGEQAALACKAMLKARGFTFAAAITPTVSEGGRTEVELSTTASQPEHARPPAAPTPKPTPKPTPAPLSVEKRS